MTEIIEDKFVAMVLQKYGDKVMYTGINSKQEDIDNLNKECGSTITIGDLADYKRCWVSEQNTCPECGATLFGIFGSFEWGIVPGIGFCSSCQKVEFQVYHYLKDMKSPLQATAIVGMACSHEWELVWVTDDLEAFRCKVCGKEQMDIEEENGKGEE